jgi:phage baseplate assembly protein W
MSVTRISRSFKDISLSFEPHPVTKDLPVITDARAIIRAIRNLVETIVTERFFNSTLGSNVRKSLFDFVDYATASVIQQQIVEVISNYEPRVSDLVVQVDPNPDANEFGIILTFRIIGQDIPVQQFSFILEATR